MGVVSFYHPTDQTRYWHGIQLCSKFIVWFLLGVIIIIWFDYIYVSGVNVCDKWHQLLNGPQSDPDVADMFFRLDLSEITCQSLNIFYLFRTISFIFKYTVLIYYFFFKVLNSSFNPALSILGKFPAIMNKL